MTRWHARSGPLASMVVGLALLGTTLASVAALPASGASPSAEPSPEPLPAASFIFERAVGDDPRREHIYRYDLETARESLVTDLAEGGTSGADIRGLAISPDRRWIAFAALFRAGPEDIAADTGGQIVWRVSPDGDRFERLSPPAPDLSLTGQPCVADPDCPALQACREDRGQCYRPGEQLVVGDPAYARDGVTTWFDVGVYTFMAGRIGGGAWLAELAEPGGLPRFMGADAGCSLVVNPAPAPVADIVLAVHSVCGPDATDGIHVWDPASGEHDVVVPSSASEGLDLPLATPVWLRDGSGFAFLGRGTFSDGERDFVGTGIYAYDIAAESVSLVVPPPSLGIDIRSFALAPDLSAAVACYASAERTELWLVPLPYEENAVPLVQDGASCDPVW